MVRIAIPILRTEQLCLNPRFFLVWAVLLLSFVGANLFAASLNATLDRTSVSVGETVILSLTFEGGSPAGQPQLPAIANLRPAGVSHSQSFSFVNGKQSSQVTFAYTLIPTKAGDVMIPSIRANVGSQTLASRPLRLTVTAAPTAETGTDGQPAEAFLKLNIPKREMYIGEILPAEIVLYCQYAQNISLPQLPAEGFTMSGIPNQPQQSQTQVNGVGYRVLTFRFTISPAKTGTLALGPATCALTLLSDVQQDFFGNVVRARQRPVTLNSETNIINVLPLPQDNKPPTFNGIIGSFNMNVSAAPADVAVGDPITVKVTISGRGALDNITLPAQPAWREFKTYPPNVKVDTTDPLGLEGTKHFELVISPQNAGIRELPPLQFSFFDPERKMYRTLSSQPFALNVRAGAATPQPTIASAAPSQLETPQQTKEIVHIKASLGTIQAAQKPLIVQPWFLVVQGLAPLLWVGSIFYRRQKESLANNPRLRRQRAVDKTVQAGLLKLKEQAAANQSEEFFSTVFHLLQERIGERLDQPASGITEAVLDDELRSRGLSAESLSLLQELFQVCNQARYAPVRGSQQLNALIPKVEQALNELKKMKHEPVAVTA